MRRLSLRRSVLTAIAGVLERWLGVVMARLEPEAPRPPADPRQPPPPDHWIELVRQHAPQLLDSESSGGDSSLVIDWRAADAEVEDISTLPTAQPRPMRLHPSPHRHTPPVATRKTAPAAQRQPLRLQRVAVEALDADDVVVHSAASVTPPIPPEFVRTTERPVTTSIPLHASGTPEQNIPAVEDRFSAPLPEAAALLEVRTTVPAVKHPRRRLFGIRLPALKLALRRREVPDTPQAPVVPHVTVDLPRDAVLHEIPTEPTQTDRLSPHFANAVFERQRIRETRSSIPEQPRLSNVSTRAGGDVPTHQRRTSIPGAPPQLVMRPTHTYPALNIEDITPDRWASLPDAPADAANDARAARYERLKREQEGRAWSE